MKTLNEKYSMAKVATDKLASFVDVDGYTIESVLDKIGFKWLHRTEYQTIVLQDLTYGYRFFLSSDWSTISYEKTEADAWEDVNQKADFEYLSANGEDTCIFQTSNCAEFVDDDGCERTMRLQCIQPVALVDECEELDQLDWSDSYPVID